MISYTLTSKAYRERWGLPSNYPIVAPAYAQRRSALAKSIGLGRKSAAALAEVPAEVTPSTLSARKRSRKPAQ